MSYDTWLEIDTGGNEPAHLTEMRNYTSNVGAMYANALDGPGITDLDGVKAEDALPLLTAAVQRMEDNPAWYRSMNPPNGWGDYDGALAYLRWIRRQCAAHPKATLRVSA